MAADAARPRVLVYDLHWPVRGGGEVYAGGVAGALAEVADVTVAGREPEHALAYLDAERPAPVSLLEVASDAEASARSASFDVFVNCTWETAAVNRAPRGVLVPYFPASVGGRNEVRRRARAVAAAAARAWPGPAPARVRRAAVAWDGRGTSGRAYTSYATLLAISPYVATWIERRWGRSSVLVPPAVRRVPRRPKEPLIVSVGRFFPDGHGHAKRQAELVRAMALLAPRLPGWRLALVGRAMGDGVGYLDEVRALARDLPVDLHVDVDAAAVDDLLGRASVYWHGAGLGVDVERHPERAEHFGIAVVEAMSAGTVPVVAGVGGPAHLVTDGVDGYHVHDVAGLAEATVGLAGDADRLAVLGAAAERRAHDFAAPVFRAAVVQAVLGTGLGGPRSELPR